MPEMYTDLMFIRTKTSPRSQSTAVQIVEAYRIDGQGKQRVLRHVGTSDDPDVIAQLKRLAGHLKAQLELQRLADSSEQPDMARFARTLGPYRAMRSDVVVRLNALQEVQRRILGIHDIYGYVYDQLGFTNLFTRPKQRAQSAQHLKDIVLARIANPKSKRATTKLLEQNYGVSLKLDHIYQMMDKIDTGFCERIQQCAYDKAQALLGGQLHVLFYDATTLYFESFIEDELKENGYSKDMKFNQPQILLTLLVTEQGLPIGYQIFPGSTFEGHTLVRVLHELKTRYQLKKVVFVADRGLFSEANLTYLEENDFEYIVGARIKNTKKSLQAAILDERHYERLHPSGLDKTAKQAVERLATFSQSDKRRLIVHYDEKRARKDKQDRDKAIEKVRQKVARSDDPKSLLSNYGYKKYIDIQGETTLTINTDKVKADARWDGLHGVVTNKKQASPQEILSYYRGLWQVEESFRINKHDLRMRPIYHWKPKRVQAHVAIAFMAFTCVRYLEYLVALQSKKLSPEVIRQSLSQVQASVLEDHVSKKRFLLASPLPPEAREIYRVVGAKIPVAAVELKRSA